MSHYETEEEYDPSEHQDTPSEEYTPSPEVGNESQSVGQVRADSASFGTGEGIVEPVSEELEKLQNQVGELQEKCADWKLKWRDSVIDGRILGRPWWTRARDWYKYHWEVMVNWCMAIREHFHVWMLWFEEGPDAGNLWYYYLSNSYQGWLKNKYHTVDLHEE